MIAKVKYILILFLGMIVTGVTAQNSQVLYYMNLPQNHLSNPALRPTNSFYIGLPAISGINLNINNNFVNFSDIFIKDQPIDSVVTFLHPENNIDDFLDKIKDKNSLEPQMSIQLFGLGFSAGKSYIFLDINDRIEGNLVLPGDLVELAFKGNEGFRGSKIDLSSLRGDLKYYREMGLGFSRDFSDKLRVGIKGKLLFGIAGGSIDNNALSISVSDTYTHTLDADLVVNMSGPLNIYMDDDQHIDSIVVNQKKFDNASGITDFVLGKKNMGLGFDIGATYEISDRIMVSAAITDFGYIKWKKDVTNIGAESQFEFSGLNMVDVMNGTKTFEEVGQEMADSLKNSFVVSDSRNPFVTWLPFGVTFGGSYKLTKSLSLGLLSYSRVIGKQIRESLTMSANLNLGNAFSTSICYTAANHRFDNLGAGLAFRPGIFQFYFITDRIPLTWNRINTGNNESSNDNSSIILPANWNNINIRFGMNLAFGNKIKKKDDKPMITVE